MLSATNVTEMSSNKEVSYATSLLRGETKSDFEIICSLAYAWTPTSYRSVDDVNKPKDVTSSNVSSSTIQAPTAANESLRRVLIKKSKELSSKQEWVPSYK